MEEHPPLADPRPGRRRDRFDYLLDSRDRCYWSGPLNAGPKSLSPGAGSATVMVAKPADAVLNTAAGKGALRPP